jgi:aminomethyltransferase
MEGEKIGTLSSGCFSPNLKIGIGMGYLPQSKVKKEGTSVLVSIRNRQVKAITSKMPFVPNTYYRTQ